MRMYIKSEYRNSLIAKEKKEDIHWGSISIFMGLVCLFLSQGAHISIANNYFFFIVAIVFNIFSMICFRQLNREPSYVHFALGYFFVLSWIYQSLGTSDFSISMSLILYISLLITCSCIKYTRRDVNIIINGIVISALVFAVLLLFFGNAYSGEIHDKYTYTQQLGTTVELEPNFLGYWIFTGFLFSIYKLIKQMELKNRKKIIFYLLVSILTMIAMLRTGSRSALVSAVVFSLCLILFIKNKKVKYSLLILFIALIVIFGLAVYFEVVPRAIYNRLLKNSYFDGSNEKRITNWYYGLKAMIDTKFGAGPYATVNVLYNMYGYGADAHNTFITFGVYFGIPGFVIFSSLVIYLIYKLWKYQQKTLVCIMIAMAVQWNILACQFSFGLWIVLLIAILTINIEKETIPEEGGENTENELI